MRAILSKNVGILFLISPRLAQERLNLKRQEGCAAGLRHNESRLRDCTAIIEQLEAYLKSVSTLKPNEVHSPGMPTNYTSIPSPPGYQPQPAVPVHGSSGVNETMGTESSQIVTSGVLYGYGSDHLDVVDETLVLPSEKALEQRLDRLYRLGDGHVQVKASLMVGAGMGLFVGTAHARSFPMGAMITEYDGLIVNHEEADKLMYQGHGSHIRALKAGHWAIHGYTTTLEAQDHGVASFANDTVNVCESLMADDKKLVRFPDKQHNAKFVMLTDIGNADANANEFVPERAHIVLVALRDLVPGEEIFVDYGAPFWNLELDQGNDDACVSS